jgi:hypothetical protein
MKRALLGILLLASVSCGDMVRQGTGSSYLIVNALEAKSGADSSAEFSGVLRSDVVTMIEDVSTIFDDPARVTFQLALKDPGPAGSPATPSTNNFITIDRYRVEFVRADGRNVPGVDVPYAFDGAFTATVADTAEVGFTLVRHQAKNEAPLTSLRRTPSFISTIARVTFYGRDQTGREVIATAQMGVNFGDFADPE